MRETVTAHFVFHMLACSDQSTVRSLRLFVDFDYTWIFCCVQHIVGYTNILYGFEDAGDLFCMGVIPLTI